MGYSKKRHTIRRIAVYTCVVGNYDIILPPRVFPDGVQYYCFTDRPKRKVFGWQMIPLVHPASVTRPDLVNRYHKIFPHRGLPQVKVSLYVDSNIRVIGDVTPWVEKIAAKGIAMALRKHPVRSTIFEEAARCKARGLFDQKERRVLEQQLAAYRAEGMPDDQQLSENGVLLRFHDAPGLSNAMELWWQQLIAYSPRDQISLPYVIWKTGLSTTLVNDIDFRAPNPYFVYNSHRKNGLRGLWQGIYLRREDIWWCGVLFQIRRCVFPKHYRLLKYRLIRLISKLDHVVKS